MQSFLLKAGYVVTFTTDAYSSSTYEVVKDPINSASGPIALSASTSTVVGPFTVNKTYLVVENGSPVTISIVFADIGSKAPLNSPSFTGYPTIAKANGTESSNAVTANGACGVITTSSLTTTAGSTYAITWTNSSIASTSVILIQNLGGTNTRYVDFTVVPGAGTATLTIDNIDLINPLNGTIKIGYLVI